MIIHKHTKYDVNMYMLHGTKIMEPWVTSYYENFSGICIHAWVVHFSDIVGTHNINVRFDSMENNLLKQKD